MLRTLALLFAMILLALVMTHAQVIIFFLLIVGGTVAVLRATGAPALVLAVRLGYA